MWNAPPPPPPPADDLEAVTLVKVIDYGHVIIQRRYGQWLLDYGVGCLSMWRYEGDAIYLVGGRLTFISIGAKLVLPDGDTCRVWGSEEL